MRRILVTGSQGFIGRYLVNTLAERFPDAEILGLGRCPANSASFGHSISLGAHRFPAPLTDEIRAGLRLANYSYERCDVRDAGAVSRVCEEFQPEVVFHLASRLRDSELRDLLDVNVAGTQGLYLGLRAARRVPFKLVLSSSGSVYGRVCDADVPIPEEAMPRPLDPYSITKYAQEHMALALGVEFRIPTAVARIFNVVGPGQEERHLCGRLASQIAAIEAGLRRPTIEHGPLGNSRDFIDVRDVARGLIVVAERGDDASVYNLGTGVETRCQEILDKLRPMARFTSEIAEEKLPGRGAFDIPRNVGRTVRISRSGYSPAYSLEASLRDVLDYYRRAASDIRA